MKTIISFVSYFFIHCLSYLQSFYFIITITSIIPFLYYGLSFFLHSLPHFPFLQFQKSKSSNTRQNTRQLVSFISFSYYLYITFSIIL